MQSVSLSWVDPSTGDSEARVFPLPLTLGRAPTSGLVLDSEVVSQKHAELRFEQGALWVFDLQSRNGLWVNQQRVTQAQLRPGDVLTLGPYDLVLRVESSDVRLRFDWTEPSTGRARTAVQRLPVYLGRDPNCTVRLEDPAVAPWHWSFLTEDGQLLAQDLTGSASIGAAGQWAQRVALTQGAVLQAGNVRVVVTVDSAARRRSAGEATLVVSEEVAAAVRAAAAPQAPQAGFVSQQGASAAPWPPACFAEKRVPLAALAQAGVPVLEADYLALGAGLGSFIWVDNLLVRGVKPEQVVALGTDPVPYSRYRRLCRNSQIPDHERLRSNSEATADCLWGWPGYGAREIARALKKGQLGVALTTSWQLLGEPALAQTFTPIASDVFDGIDRECKRIGWERVMRYGRVRAVRLTEDGRYVVALSQKAPAGQDPHALLIARYVHLATGYPALQFLPDLQRYREETEDFQQVVNAYEDHDHVYQRLEQQGGQVVLRGRGIVASRVLQRLWEARRRNPNIAVLHLLRSPLKEGHRWRRAKRDVDNHYELQPFNWPKACWGGDLRELLEKSTPEERKRLLTDWGGTTTARRPDWLHIVREGLAQGWYQIVFGEVDRVERTEAGRVATMVRSKGPVAGHARYEADVVIDATGLDAKVRTNPLLADLVDHYGLGLNVVGRMAVNNEFELEGLRNGEGRVYAAGAMTLGGPYAPVDSFLGLQYNAQVTLDALTRAGAPGLRSLTLGRSVSQWLKWAAGSAP